MSGARLQRPLVVAGARGILWHGRWCRCSRSGELERQKLFLRARVKSVQIPNLELHEWGSVPCDPVGIA